MDIGGAGEYIVVCREMHFESEPPLVLLQNKDNQYAWGREDLIMKYGVGEQCCWTDLQGVAQAAVRMVRCMTLIAAHKGSYHKFGLALADFVGEARYTLAVLGQT